MSDNPAMPHAIPLPLSTDDIRAHLRRRSALLPGTYEVAWPGGTVQPDRGAPILFLDVDGVLHPDACDPVDHFSRWPLLEAVLEDVPGVDVVWSSTWRFQKGWDVLMARVPQRLHRRFLGATPAHLYPRGDACPIGPRRLEVEGFLSLVLGDPHRPWVALEDSPLYDGAEHGRVLYCDPATGLREGATGMGHTDQRALKERLNRLVAAG